MKKLVLFAAVIFGLSSMNAQKNSILLGGNVGYSHSEVKAGKDKDKIDSYDWSPYLGYQFADNWSIAAQVKFSKSDLTDGQNQQLGLESGDVKTQKIGGFVRYSLPLSETFSFYGDLGAGWQEQKTKGRLFGTNDKVTAAKLNGYYIGFTPSLFINFKNNFGLNFNIGGIEYSHLKQSGTSNKQNDWNFTFGNSANIGIVKNFSL